MAKKKKAKARAAFIAQQSSGVQKPAEVKPQPVQQSQTVYKLKPDVIKAGIGLVLVLVGLFLIIQYASNRQNSSTNQQNQTSPTPTTNESVATSTTPTPTGNTESTGNTGKTGSVASQGIETYRSSASTDSSNAKAEANNAFITGSGRWRATDYAKGDIGHGSYTVNRGDTLWEIAEAAYGSGFQWTKILAANSGSIGFLPNHQQALIRPGQVLVIP